MNIAFVGTETLGLDADIHPVWEVGLILRDESGEDTEFHWFLPVESTVFADPHALEITHFHDRHPQGIGFIDPKDGRTSRIAETLQITDHETFSRRFAALTRGALWVGDVPSFDEERLRRMLRANGVPPMWHYVLVDVAVAAAATMKEGPLVSDQDLEGWYTVVRSEQHTALGDARWARDLYDLIW